MTLGVIAFACLVAALVAPAAGRIGGVASWLLATAGAILMALVGALGLAGHVWTSDVGGIVAPLWNGSGPGLDFQVDPLASLFLLLIGGVAVPALLVCASWWWRDHHVAAALPASVGLLLTACWTVVVAGNAWTLLLGWEGVTLAFYWMTMTQRRREGRVEAALAAGIFGKLSGAFLTAGLFLLVADSRTAMLDGFGGAHGPARDLGYVLLLAAFATKIGLVPLHVWLPRSYSAAPGPVRALMAGVAVNVGFYGCWRTFEVLGAPPGWLADVVMVLGGISAIVGIAHASVQTRLSRVIAYSSVENAGLILAGLGVALVGSVTDAPRLVAAGLVAGTLQTVAHAIGKTLLFVSGGMIESAVGSDDLDRLRGVARRMPWSGSGLAIGAVTMAGLPPTVLFVSEWFTLESLMQQFRLDHRLAYTLPMALTGALVALTAGFAGIAFIRLAAFTALGRTGSSVPDDAGRLDARGPARVGLAILGAATVVVAGLAPFEIRLIGRGVSGIVPARVVDQAVTDHWILGPVYGDFSVLSPSWLALELPIALAVVLLGSRLLAGARMWQVREVDPWRSASGGVSGADEYTPYGYANPTRRVLANVLRPHAEVEVLEQAERERTGAELSYRADVVEVSERFLYRPLAAVVRAIVGVALRLQSGRLDAYLLYMLVALVAVLLVAVTR